MMIKREFIYAKKMIAMTMMAVMILSGCGKNEENVEIAESDEVVKTEVNEPKTQEVTEQPFEEVEETIEPEAPEVEVTEQETPAGNEFSFVDVFGEEYKAVIADGIPLCSYDKDLFVHDGNKVSYGDNASDYRLGIDVSHHNGEIDWAKVKEEGFDFAFLRIGYRGYGQEGKLCKDKMFDENYAAAREAGLEVGAYFYSQAINEEEALEEAEFVLGLLGERTLDLPIVYDPESVLDAEARTDNVTGEQFTKNAVVFCNVVRDAGITPGIYANMLWEAFELDLTALPDIFVWYADYEDKPQTPYDFKCWQYTNTGKVSGVQGEVDINIYLGGRG